MRLIILAAGMGTRLSPLTDNKPKCLVPVKGRPIIEWTLDAAKAAGFQEIVVVGGYRADQLSKYDVTLVVNEHFDSTNMVHSLFLAREYFGDAFVMSYGDIVYTADVLKKTATSGDGVHIVVDTKWEEYWRQRFTDPLIDAETLKISDEGKIVGIGQQPKCLSDCEAQYIGLANFSGSGVRSLLTAWQAAQQAGKRRQNPFGGQRTLHELYMTDLVQGMAEMGVPISPVYIEGHWLEIDTLTDLEIAETLLDAGRMD